MPGELENENRFALCAPNPRQKARIRRKYRSWQRYAGDKAGGDVHVRGRDYYESEAPRRNGRLSDELHLSRRRDSWKNALACFKQARCALWSNPSRVACPVAHASASRRWRRERIPRSCCGILCFGISERRIGVTPRREFFRGKAAIASGDKFQGSFLEPFEFGFLG